MGQNNTVKNLSFFHKSILLQRGKRGNKRLEEASNNFVNDLKNNITERYNSKFVGAFDIFLFWD
jgi:hypothetical protein